VAKKYVTVYNLCWLGWKYIVYKLLAYGYLNNLDKLGRYCGSPHQHSSCRLKIITHIIYI